MNIEQIDQTQIEFGSRVCVPPGGKTIGFQVKATFSGKRTTKHPLTSGYQLVTFSHVPVLPP